MSGRKNQLASHPIFDTDTGQAMTGTGSLFSKVSAVGFLDNILYDLSFTGTPSGAFTVQVALDHNDARPNDTVWRDLTISGLPVAAGTPDSIQISMNQLPYNFTRVRYVNTSGTGVLSGKITGKMI